MLLHYRDYAGSVRSRHAAHQFVIRRKGAFVRMSACHFQPRAERKPAERRPSRAGVERKKSLIVALSFTSLEANGAR